MVRIISMILIYSSLKLACPQVINTSDRCMDVGVDRDVRLLGQDRSRIAALKYIITDGAR